MNAALPMQPAKTRDLTIDFARIVAALFVIYVHSSGAWGRSTDPTVWTLANLTNTIGHASVPLFLMMSGALVIGRPIGSYGPYLKKRAATTLRPYLVGTIVYLVIQKVTGTLPPTHATIQNVLLGIPYLHLYFLFVLFGMYLLTPLLQGIASAPKSTVIGTMLALFGLAALSRIVWPFGFVLGYLSLGTCYTFLPYFLSGYVLRHLGQPGRRWHVPMFVVPIVVTMAAQWALTPELADNFQQYDSPTVMVMSVGAFCLLMRVRFAASPLVALMSRVADLTLGIYVLHLAVLIGMSTWLAPSFGPAWHVALFPPLCFVITAGLVRVLHLIPGAKGWI